MTIQELLADESKWTKNAYARLPTGEPCASSHPEATCWCLVGAVNRCYGPEYKDVLSHASSAYDMRREVEHKLRTAIEQAEPDEPWYDYQPELHSWNDDSARTFEDVRRIVELAGV